MSVDDWVDFDNYWDFEESEHDEDRYEQHGPSVKTCHHCGQEDLIWGRRKGKWRLFDGEQIHVCPNDPAKDFADA